MSLETSATAPIGGYRASLYSPATVCGVIVSSTDSVAWECRVRTARLTCWQASSSRKDHHPGFAVQAGDLA